MRSSGRGFLANCYARNIEVANTIIFQGATDVAHIAALAMTVIMVIHVRSKFTAVGTYGASPEIDNGMIQEKIEL